MTNDNELYELSRRNVLAGLGGVGLAAAGAGLGTSALFSDTESFEGNTLTAGTLDLKVDWQQTYDGPDGLVPVNAYPDHDGDGLQSLSDDAEYSIEEPAPIEMGCKDLASGDELPADVFEAPNRTSGNGGPLAEQSSLVALSDVKPGDHGEITFSFHLCDNPGYVWLQGELVSASENGITEPESEVDSAGNSSSGDGVSSSDVSTMQSGFSVSSGAGNSISAETMAQSLVAGASGLNVVSASFDGASEAGGTFSGGSSVYGVEKGIILSTGDVEDIEGPNQSDSTSTDNGTDGDSDLEAIADSTVNETNDAAVLEFDFEVPAGADTVYFDYLFGSDEYNEYVDQYNDVFGFFVNPDDNTPSDANVATVNGDPVSINTINKQDNSGLYNNNDPDDFQSPPHDTEADGFTDVLQVEAPVNPGETNTFKLAIADANDSALDAWVLIEGDSLSTEPEPEPEPEPGSGSELPDAIQARAWYDDGDNVHQEDEEVFLEGTLRDVLTELASGNGVPLDGDQGDDFDEIGGDPTASERACYSAEDPHYLGFEWWIPTDVGNEIQSDSATFDLGFYAEQCRNNDGSGPTSGGA
jgi:Ca-activated chloride channel family protein